MQENAPLFKKGEFVQCSYQYYDYFSYIYGEHDYPYFKFYGIVVDFEWDRSWYNLEMVYRVYCMDGNYRYFLEDELCLV